MQIKSKSNRFGERATLDVDLSHMRTIGLTDSEVEFLYMKRMKVNPYAPDPRLGDYDFS